MNTFEEQAYYQVVQLANQFTQQALVMQNLNAEEPAVKYAMVSNLLIHIAQTLKG